MPEGTFDGPVITGTAGQWIWVPEGGAKCRDGSTTGFGVRLNPASTQLYIYLEGGGACFNAVTCAANPSTFGSSNFDSWRTGSGQSGIFDNTNAANPLRDWNAVYIPYCTGDVHFGNATNVTVPGFGPSGQMFVGYVNIGLFLKRIVPTFAGVNKVLLTGSSAGGFGAFFNYHRVAQAFCPKETVLIDDSGPVMSDGYLAACLQKRWRQVWNIAATLPAGCTDCTGSDGGNIVNLTNFLGRTYSTRNLGLISSDQDAVISTFYGYGKNNCANIDLINTPLSGATFQAGLADLRTNYFSQSPAWSSYYIASMTHTYLGGSGFYSTTVQGTKMTDWMSGMLTSATAKQIGP